MGKITIHIQTEGCEELDAVQLMNRLKNPKWNYANLKQYLSLFTGESVSRVEHVFECIGDESHQNILMLMAWVLCDDQAYHLYCVHLHPHEQIKSA